MNITNLNIEKLNNIFISKSKNDKNELNIILKDKVNMEELNTIINQIKKEINIKVNNIEFQNAMNNQAMINDIICNENQVGRWLWKKNKKKGLAIPWDTQSVNTAPDNYLWERDKTIINIINGGLYQISLGLYYYNKKPQIQIIINNDNVINVKNNYLNENKGNNFKKINSVSYIDFILLQDNSKIIITFNAEEGFGFLGLKKL